MTQGKHDLNPTDTMNTMNIIKRNGTTETVQFDKVLERIRKASSGLSVNYTRLAQLVLGEIHDNIHTSQLDEIAARMAVSYLTVHPDWGVLASRIIISNCQKLAPRKFSDAMALLKESVLHPDVSAFILANAEELNTMIQHQHDFLLDYFGFKTLEKAYIHKHKNGNPIETPQYLWMRVSVGIHHSFPDAIDRIRETYTLMSSKAFTHATPTLFNSGSKFPQLSSCFLLGIDDSLEGMYDTLKKCALISKYAGGIGVHISNIRAQGSYIAGTNGTSDGLVPFLRVYNDTARHVNQSGRRNGSFAMYLEPWHADVQAFIKLKSNKGNEEERARDLFYALWVPDLFMSRVEEDKPWSLFCPNECPGLSDVTGDDFVALYERYEREGKARKSIPARTLWNEILISQIEVGTPYLLYKDAANRKSNQQNLGVIKSSNLCTEIIEYSNSNETAVCNLASIALPYFIEGKTFNFARLREVVAVIVRNLNRIIDINYYPVEDAKVSNLRHRPLGIGVQGLADVFAMLGLPWESPGAAALNQEIFENLYFAAMSESVEAAVRDGSYETFGGSPASKGLLQPDLWTEQEKSKTITTYLDWDRLRHNVKTVGIRNSLLVAPMPTASTSQILGYNECIEPFTTNIYVRRTLAGEFTMVNRYLVADIMKIDPAMWTPELKDSIIAANGSIQNIPAIPDELKQRYKTVWEIKQKTLIDMAADRGAYICQSQSLNLFVSDPTILKLSSMHFYAWRKGLKTGMYYLRTKSAVQPIKVTIEATAASASSTASSSEPAECLMCSS
jgi:ribonucleoside-diphosphate reductase alpha subunit